MLTDFNIKVFNTFYSRYYDSFVRFATTYVKNRDTAEDFVSDSFTKLWEKRGELAPDTNLQAYVLTIIKNNCLNHLKREKLKLNIVNDLKDLQQWELQTRINTLEATDPEEIFSDEIKKLVQKSLNKLPERTLQVFLMSRKQFKTNKEIAELLNITTKGVEFHISKALKELRSNLSDYMPFILLLII